MIRPVVMILSIVAILVPFCGCGGSESKEMLYVYCDEVLKPAATKIVQKFESESGYAVKLICDPEDRVFRRMKLSNHADVYISMIPTLIDRTVSLGLSKEAEPICYIVPTMITTPLNPRGIDSIEDFEKADIRFGFCEEDLILGEMTKQLFEKNGFNWKDAHEKAHLPTRDEEFLILNIQESQLDVGIVWSVTAQNAERVECVAFPSRKNVRLPVVALELKKSERSEATAKLIQFMRSPKANAIWEKNGLEPCGEGAE